MGRAEYGRALRMTVKLTKIIGFAPDLPVTTPGILTACSGILPSVRGICSPPTFGAVGGSVIDSAGVNGSAQMAKADGTLRRYIGTGTKLWEFDGGSTLTDRSGAAYSASATQGWSFCEFGDVSLASNLGDAIQKSTGGAFSALATAPKAAIIVNVGFPASPFVMALNYNDGTATPDGWYCSGISDYTTWNSASAQSVNGRLLEPTGPFIAAVPFRDGVIAWKANAMYRGDYVGSPVVWSWTRIASDIGCCGKNMAVVVNDRIYFADKRGFWSYDGSYPKPIPGYVHDYWAQTVAGFNTSSVVKDVHQMRWDPVNHNLWISFESDATIKYLFWNQISGIWTAALSGLSTDAANALVSIISMEPTMFVVATDKKVSLGTLGSSTPGLSGNQTPTFSTWYEGDQQLYVNIDRVIPCWTNTGTGMAGASSAPTAATTCALISAPDQLLSSSTTGTPAALSASEGYVFDVIASAHFMAASLSLVGKWNMSHIGLSVCQAGTGGKA